MKNSQKSVDFLRESGLRWLSSQCPDAPVSSNVGSAELPFQRWFRFKEAYSPEFVRRVIDELPYEVSTVLDPFSGSGTTAVTCRMLGIDSVSIELNPFLADLVKAKVTRVSPASFLDNCYRIIDALKVQDSDYLAPDGAPSTLVEPGKNERWIFGREVFGTIRALLRSLSALSESEARLAKILLGGIIVDCSNVHVNGKGRRYRKNWAGRNVSKEDVLSHFERVVSHAADDLIQFSANYDSTHVVHNEDAKIQLKSTSQVDTVIFSPPYPNSFDYTDVYNLELWMLGYLNASQDNRTLRSKTLRSHVQIKWPRGNRSLSSQTLSSTVKALEFTRNDLWNKNIPEMVHGYFDDLENIFQNLTRIIPNQHHVTVAVGDSQYAGIKVDVPQILSEVVEPLGFTVEKLWPIRSMRSSAQHGGQLDLAETAITFRKNK